MNKCIFIGRLVNDPEISSYEKNGESQALDEIKKAHSDINYWIPTEDDIVGAIISKAGESKKLLLFFKSSKVMPVYMDMSLYTPILIKNAEELNYNSLSAVF